MLSPKLMPTSPPGPDLPDPLPPDQPAAPGRPAPPPGPKHVPPGPVPEPPLPEPPEPSPLPATKLSTRTLLFSGTGNTRLPRLGSPTAIACFVERPHAVIALRLISERTVDIGRVDLRLDDKNRPPRRCGPTSLDRVGGLTRCNPYLLNIHHGVL
jgi:hypothetical protein